MEIFFSDPVKSRLVIQLLSFLLASLGGGLAIFTLLQNYRTNRSKFAIETMDIIFKDNKLQKFWYRIDYDDEKKFVFDIATFRHSKEEMNIDRILFKFSIIGNVIRHRSLNVDDIIDIFPLIRQFFSNSEIKKYLSFVHLDFWMDSGHTHLHWPNAFFLFEMMLRKQIYENLVPHEELEQWISFVQQLTKIPKDPALRKWIADELNYDRHM